MPTTADFIAPDEPAAAMRLVNRDTWDRALLFSEQAAQYGVIIIPFGGLDMACTWLGIDMAETRKLPDGIST